MNIDGANDGALRFAVEVVHAHQLGDLDEAWVRDALAADRLPVRNIPATAQLPALVAALDELSADLIGLFRAGTAETAAALVNDLLAPHALRLSVSTHDGQLAHLHFDHADHGVAARVRVNCLAALAGVLCDGSGQSRLGSCAADRCPRVFLDRTRATRQRFCSPGCAGRTHVAAHRARLRST